MKKIILILILISLSIQSQNFDYTNYNQFLKNYVSEKGNVKYDKIKSNKAQLTETIKQFQNDQPNEKWSRNEKLCYWINTYNVYTIKAIIDNYPAKSIRDIENVWEKRNIPFNKVNFSLSDIENKILRKMDEPRIHFAINCASYSCPKLENNAFLPQTIEKQLETATKEFINDSSKNNFSGKEVKISEIFNWYAADFKTNGTIIGFINKYAKNNIPITSKFSYMDYNWNLNK